MNEANFISPVQEAGMKAINIRAALFLLLLTFIGCSGQSKYWVSHPEKEITGNPFYRAELTPLKEDGTYYVKFRFQFTNLTEEPLFIEWNRSFYILDNKVSGHFLFEGITREIALSGNIPEERIDPGKTTTREMVPVERMVAVKDETKKGSTPQIYQPGLIPKGENGIYLTVHQNSRFIRGKIAVQILPQ